MKDTFLGGSNITDKQHTSNKTGKSNKNLKRFHSTCFRYLEISYDLTDANIVSKTW
jgi:hypothetical protein